MNRKQNKHKKHTNNINMSSGPKNWKHQTTWQTTIRDLETNKHQNQETNNQDLTKNLH
jgi:hypothetical protein